MYHHHQARWLAGWMWGHSSFSRMKKTLKFIWSFKILKTRHDRDVNTFLNPFQIRAHFDMFFLATSKLVKSVPDRSCLMRPLLLPMSTGSMSLNQEISGSGFPLAAHSIVAVRVFSTTFSWGPISMVGKPWGIWFSKKQQQKNKTDRYKLTQQRKTCFWTYSDSFKMTMIV